MYVGQGYSTVATNLIRFNELQAMPMPIDKALEPLCWNTWPSGTNPAKRNLTSQS